MPFYCPRQRTSMGRLRTLFTAVTLLCVAHTLFANHYPVESSCAPRVQVRDVDQTRIFPQPVLEEHKYHTDGLLETVAAGRHPVYDLIARAEKDWDARQKRASRTLPEAVTEYKRRYGRHPPKGFDKWWEYVQRHDVQLPDEYDQIYHDLEPYWGMDPTDLQELYTEVENAKSDFVILTKEDGGHLDVLNLLSRPERRQGPAWDMMELLADVQEHLPPFRAIFNYHDGPNRLNDFEMKQTLLKAAENGSVLRREDLVKPKHRGWRSACDPTSRASTLTLDLDGPEPSKPSKTFIYDHRLAMDSCLHPDLWWTHGQFVSRQTGPKAQPAMVPEFTCCSTSIYHNIRVPSFYGWVDGVSSLEDPAWEDKVDERMVWRGLNTGMTYSESTRWNMSHRTRLLEKTNSLAGAVDILPPGPHDKQVGLPVLMKNAFLSPALFDVGVADKYFCSGSVCAYLEERYPPKNRQTGKDTWRHKYLLDVDGNGWSGRFRRLMSSNSLVFKSTIYPEWYMDRVQPWVHYIPVQVDLSDLHDTLMFFRGGLDGKDGHDDLAKKIAYAGKRWTETYWRKEDMTAYLFRLFLEYGRVMSEDRLVMSYSL